MEITGRCAPVKARPVQPRRILPPGQNLRGPQPQKSSRPSVNFAARMELWEPGPSKITRPNPPWLDGGQTMKRPVISISGRWHSSPLKSGVQRAGRRPRTTRRPRRQLLKRAEGSAVSRISHGQRPAHWITRARASLRTREPPDFPCRGSRAAKLGLASSMLPGPKPDQHHETTGPGARSRWPCSNAFRSLLQGELSVTPT